MATRLLLITVQTIACSQFNIACSSGMTAKGKQEQSMTQKACYQVVQIHAVLISM